MAKHSPSFSDQHGANVRPPRPFRGYLWGLASWLQKGGIVAAFYLAWRTGNLGVVAFAAFLGGFVLRQILEATSLGD